MDPVIIAAIVSAIVSLIVALISPFIRKVFDGYFLLFRLETENEYEQRKKIKKILSRNKIHLMNSGESLNHRLWNFSNNYSEKWHCVGNNYNTLRKDNYFISFVYRLIAFYAWQKKMDNEMVFLDTTIASKDDLILIKFIKLFQQIMCDVKLFEGYDYDKSKATDHFFNDNFEEMIALFLKTEAILSFSQFKEEIEEYTPTIKPIMDFINGIDPNENRYRWEKMQILHLCLIAFLNSYGYDYQYTKKKKIVQLIDKYKDNRLVRNYNDMIIEYRLDNQKELKNILGILNSKRY